MGTFHPWSPKVFNPLFQNTIFYDFHILSKDSCSKLDVAKLYLHYAYVDDYYESKVMISKNLNVAYYSSCINDFMAKLLKV